MKKLLRKELALALHPAALLFLLLSAMLLIPNYPYYVIFFYTGLGIFFICLNGRENKDIMYTMLLPIPKRQIVQARFLLAILLEVTQFLLAIPFAILRNTLLPFQNEAGMGANTALFGIALLLVGVFNLLFFTSYYQNTDKVGISFVRGCIGFTILMILFEAADFAIPFVREVLDTKDPLYLSYKLAILGIGIASYLLLTLAAYGKSVKSFEARDL